MVPLRITKSKNKLAVEMYQNITILIKNTSFISNTITYLQPLITIPEQVLLLDGPVLFIDVHVQLHLDYGILIDSSNTVVQFHNYIEISNCSGYSVFSPLLFSMLKSPVRVNIVHNNFQYFSKQHKKDEQSMCTFQYFNEQNLNILFRKKMKLGYSVIFQANKWVTKLSFSLTTTHCSWLTGSAFNTTIPVDVNQRFITFVNETFVTRKKGLCYCSEISTI